MQRTKTYRIAAKAGQNDTRVHLYKMYVSASTPIEDVKEEWLFYHNDMTIVAIEEIMED